MRTNRRLGTADLVFREESLRVSQTAAQRLTNLARPPLGDVRHEFVGYVVFVDAPHVAYGLLTDNSPRGMFDMSKPAVGVEPHLLGTLSHLRHLGGAGVVCSPRERNTILLVDGGIFEVTITQKGEIFRSSMNRPKE